MDTFGSHLRTSQSHPLIIDTIKAANGALGLTFCPGKRQHESMTGGWNRDIDTDLKAIHDWGADIVISLMERFEYSEIHVAELPQRFEQEFQLWLDLPIVDRCAPTPMWSETWSHNRMIIANALHSGQRILIHCKGGLGRTGTVAAMILNDLGMTMDESVQTVRSARTGAVETREQEEFLAHYELRERQD